MNINPQLLTGVWKEGYALDLHTSTRQPIREMKTVKKIKSTSQLKEIDDPAKRKEVLHGAFSIQNGSLSGKKVLLFDDLYRSGETLNAACDIMINQGKAKSVYALTITKTRSKR